MAHEQHSLKPGALEFDREVDSPSLLLGVWVVIVLMALASIGLSSLGLGKFALPMQLAIATIQAGLVAYYFMHLRQGDRVVLLTALSSLFWMAILFVLVLADYLTRSWHVGW
jgi:cytochrome c oxidase subunit 4